MDFVDAKTKVFVTATIESLLQASHFLNRHKQMGCKEPIVVWQPQEMCLFVLSLESRFCFLVANFIFLGS